MPYFSFTWFIRSNCIQVEALLPHSSLPDKVDLNIFEDWYVNLRRGMLALDKMKKIEEDPTMFEPCCDSENKNFITDVSAKLKELGEKLLQKNNIQGILLCISISGSHLYLPNSM